MSNTRLQQIEEDSIIRIPKCALRAEKPSHATRGPVRSWWARLVIKCLESVSGVAAWLRVLPLEEVALALRAGPEPLPLVAVLLPGLQPRGWVAAQARWGAPGSVHLVGGGWGRVWHRARPITRGGGDATWTLEKCDTKENTKETQKKTNKAKIRNIKTASCMEIPSGAPWVYTFLLGRAGF